MNEEVLTFSNLNTWVLVKRFIFVKQRKMWLSRNDRINVTSLFTGTQVSSAYAGQPVSQ